MAEYIDGEKKEESQKDEDKLKKCRRWAKNESDSRLKQEALWYEIQLYKDGDHYNLVNRTNTSGGTIKVVPITRQKGEVQRTFNKFRSLLRALKATATSTEIRFEVPGGSEEEVLASNYLNWYTDKHEMSEQISDVVDYGFTRSVAYFDVYWDSMSAMPKVEARDPFDLLVDRHGKYARRTYSMRKDDFKEAKDSEGQPMFKNTEELPTTRKLASSEIYDNYLRSKYQQKASDGIEDIMVEEFHKLEQGDDGKYQVRVITTAEDSDKIFAEEVYEDDELRFVPFWPERRPGDIYNEPWMKDALDPQKSLDNMYTHFEELIRTMGKGRIIVRKGQVLDRISDKDGQKIEFEGEKPEIFPVGSIGGDQFSFDQKVEANMEDVVGIHPSQIRKTTTAKGIGYLIAQDETNISEPFKNLKTSLVKVGKRLIKLANRHMMTSQDIFWWNNGQRERGAVISPNSPIIEGGQAPEGVGMIKNIDSLTVDLLPKGAFAALAREEKIMNLVKAGILTNPEVIAEGMNLGNVRELYEKEMAFRQEQAQMQAQQQPQGAAEGQPNEDFANQEALQEAVDSLKAEKGLA